MTVFVNDERFYTLPGTLSLLILDVLQFKSPAHGYEIRRELETWHAE